MRNYNYYIPVIAILGYFPVIAQRDTITHLDEVIVSDLKLRDFSNGYKSIKIKDSVLVLSSTSLTDLIRTNSTLYLRENGVGGVSSVSFRGTNASQTTVVWNGININSQLNGQTDFNTISVRNYDDITIRSGGGSAPYGSGAIGGSIHLNSNFKFNRHFTNRLITSLGSFVTSSSNYKGSYGTEKFNITFGMDHSTSKNDHLYLGTKGKRNENGDFKNLNLNLNFGYYLTSKSLIKIFQNNYIGERNFSGTIFAPSDDGYKDDHSRSLVQWHYYGQQFTSTWSAAYLHERFRFLANNENDDFDFGKADSFILKYDFDYSFSKRIRLHAILEHTNTNGKGTAIPLNKRNISSGTLLFAHRLGDRFNYGAHIKQEITNNYSPPLVYAIDGTYNFSSFYTLKLNASKNFRMPAYNDLYWLGQGNPDLKPETSLQGELVQQFNYGGVGLSITTFYIETKDLIQWKPGISNIWRPQNVNETINYGLELGLTYQKQWKKSKVLFEADYAYTIAQDQKEKSQLLYVPVHKGNASLAYYYKRFSAYYQLLWTDQVFLTSDNSQFIAGFDVSTVGLNYTFYAQKNSKYQIGLKTANIYNEIYQLVGSRPAPNRNFQVQLILKF